MLSLRKLAVPVFAALLTLALTAAPAAYAQETEAPASPAASAAADGGHDYDDDVVEEEIENCGCATSGRSGFGVLSLAIMAGALGGARRLSRR